MSTKLAVKWGNARLKLPMESESDFADSRSPRVNKNGLQLALQAVEKGEAGAVQTGFSRKVSPAVWYADLGASRKMVLA